MLLHSTNQSKYLDRWRVLIPYFRYIEQTPLPVRKAMLRQDTTEYQQLRREKRKLADDPTNCSWTIEVGYLYTYKLK